MPVFSQKTTLSDTTEKDVVFEKVEVEASFPGGEKAWTQYIKQQLMENLDALIKANKSGTCRLKFIVGKDGNIRNVEAVTMKGTKLAKVGINAILKGPKWIPAFQDGRTVNAFREQPITFTLQDK
ncbi:MAG: energy transducer TonB [Ginsengibacter sp.]